MQKNIMRSHSKSERAWQALKSLAVSGLILVVLNAPFWVLGQETFLLRPMVNFDSAIAVLLAWWSPIAALVFVLIAWVVDGLQSMSVVYHFQSTADFLRTVQFAGEINFLDLMGFYFFAVIGIFGMAAFALRMLWAHCMPRMRHYALVCVFLAVLDVVNGSSGATPFGRDDILLGSNLAGSPMLNLVSSTAQTVIGTKGNLRTINSGPAIDDLVGWAENNPDRGILVIIVESLGLHRDPEIADWLKSQLYGGDVVTHWTLQYSTIPFKGATTSGELRTLCQLAGHYMNIEPKVASNCLPTKLKALQWRASAWHGFSGGMFNRRHWWPILGFDRVLFAEDLVATTPRCGGAFNGVCDANLLHLAVAEAQTPKSLTYLLTLNTHLPLTPEPIPREVGELCESHQVSKAVCQLIAQQGSLLRKARDELSLVKNRPLIVVVGDHAPPFSSVRDRTQFHDSLVPLLMLTPEAAR